MTSPPTIADQKVQQGLALHRAGRIAEAQALYASALQVDPRHFDALHMLGVAALQTGRIGPALQFLDAAVAVNPLMAQAHQNRGVALSEARRFADAVASFERALALDPASAEGHFSHGNALTELGRFGEATASYRRAVKIEPRFDAYYNLANALCALGRAGEAVDSYDRAIALKPDFVDAHFNRANVLKDKGRLEAAATGYRRALDLDPRHAGALNNCGNALSGLGRLEEALAVYERAAAALPTFADAEFNRGNTLKDLGRAEDAVIAYDRALALRPAYTPALVNRGVALRDLGRIEAAVASYDAALRLDPALADAHFNRANALCALGRLDEAIAAYGEAIRLKPAEAAHHCNLGDALMGINRAEALKSYDRALALRPDYPEALNNRANALRELLRPEDALRDYDHGLALKPGSAELHENRGLVLVELGHLDAALVALKEGVRLGPTRVRSYYSLADAWRFTAGDPYLEAMEAMAANSAALTAEDRIRLDFALGKALADTGDVERSFDFLLQANALKRAEITYDEAATFRRLARIGEAFTRDRLQRGEGGGDPSPKPIFIVGMPRSGTTLVEQILASHPLVYAAGEIEDLGLALGAFGAGEAAPLRSPDAAAAMTPAQLQTLGADYLRRISQPAPAGALRISNKTLDNFRHLGLIRMALPGARIVHVRRDPADTCLSIFSKLFVGDLPYAYDLGELGRYYRAYAGVMARWRAVLPTTALLDLRYEDLVADPEAEIRRLLAHCGLPWDAACLDFHTAARPVRTASVMQVRQPMFRTAVGRQRPDAARLKPLLDALDETPV